MTKVIVTRNGLPEEYSADIVVVSCGAVNSAALLLRSANEKHPGGLANGSDVVGPKLYASQLLGIDGDFQGSQSHRVPEDARVE